jgi:hypothetical protein
MNYELWDSSFAWNGRGQKGLNSREPILNASDFEEKAPL